MGCGLTANPKTQAFGWSEWWQHVYVAWGWARLSRGAVRLPPTCWRRFASFGCGEQTYGLVGANRCGTTAVAAPKRHSSKLDAFSGASGPTYTVFAPLALAEATKPAAG